MMKQTLIAMTLMLVTGAAVAAEGGFKGPDNAQQVTVKEVADLPDDTQVKLSGHLVKSLGDEEYEFRDETGSLTVEIDNDVWNGLEVAPEQKVLLRGEVEQEWNHTELEVDQVTLVE